METIKKSLGWCGKKLLLTAFVAAIAFVVCVGYDEEEIRPRTWDMLTESDVKSFALEDQWAGNDKLSAKDIDWTNMRSGYDWNLIPANAVDWDDVAAHPIVPVAGIDWKSSDFSVTGKEVRVVDLDGDEEVLVVKRGDTFSAYKVKASGYSPNRSRYSSTYTASGR